MSRIFNFSAGPAMLPAEVLARAGDEMLDWHGSGMSVMEMSHRGKEFISIAEEAESDLRELLAIPASFKVLFLQGGATLQFAQVPMNLLHGRARPTTSSPANGRRRRSRKRRSTATPRSLRAPRTGNSTYAPKQWNVRADPRTPLLLERNQAVSSTTPRRRRIPAG